MSKSQGQERHLKFMEGMTRILSLVRWLGPWASIQKRPAFITEETLWTADHRLPIRFYRPRGPISGAYMISMGLHPMGLLEPRLDRLGRILASLGNIVAIPGYPDYRAMRLDPRVIEDARTGFQLLLDQPEVGDLRPTIFAISFGSAPALRLACDPVFRDRLALVISFGGVADYHRLVLDTIGSPLEGVPPSNPVALPAVVINLVEHLAPGVEEARILHRAWRQMAWALWGKSRAVQKARWDALAREIGAALDEELRPIFFCGVGLDDSRLIDTLDAIRIIEPRLRSMDPRPHFHDLHCPVRFVHGLDDFVVPPVHSVELDRAVPATIDHDLIFTGLYNHSGTSFRSISLAAMAAEAGAMKKILTMMASGRATPNPGQK